MTETTSIFKKNALVSVWDDDKPSAVNFVHSLVGMGWVIWSSGGTARDLAKHRVEVQDIASLVGGDPILGHRVVTLSREIHAGLLARDIPEDHAELQQLGIPWFDLIYNTWYPLTETIRNSEGDLAAAIESTDMGGPGMCKSGVKGGRIVVCDPTDLDSVLEHLQAGSPNDEQFRLEKGHKALGLACDYYLPLRELLASKLAV